MNITLHLYRPIHCSVAAKLSHQLRLTDGDTNNNIHCVPKNIPDIFDCNVKKDYRILIIFGTNIPETTCRQVTI